MKTIKNILKKVILTAFFLTLFSAQAQAPQKMSYQAVIRNASDALVANTLIGIRISVLQATANGLVVYSETHTPTTNINGLASFEIGAGTVLSGDFPTINWGVGPYFIKTETDPEGGTNYTISGTSQLVSVPYALFAANASSTSYWTKTGTDIINNNTGNVGIGVVGAVPRKLTVEQFGIGISQQSDANNGPQIGLYTSTFGAFLQTHNNFDLSFATNDGSTQMVLQKGTGNLGLGNTGILQNKFQIGNPPGFEGNDIAIGNGTQGMSLYQGPTASTFFTNTNFAFMPANGLGNVGIGTITPNAKLEVVGSAIINGNINVAGGSNNGIYANTTGGLNMVPLGIVSYQKPGGNSNAVFNNIHANETGSLAFSSTCNVEINSNDSVSIKINLDAAVCSQYIKIIAVGSPTFVNSDSCYGSYFDVTNLNGNYSLNVYYLFDSLSTFNNIKGTFMIYGIK
jgi:hypothetical protein